jgi:hypothetical protein
MTDRIFPPIALPRADGATRPAGTASPVGEPLARPGVRPAVARPAVAHQQERFFTTPSRAVMLLATSATVYAVSLAAVAGLQASDDAALAARRQPYLDAIARSRAVDDALAAAVAGAGSDASTLASGYTNAADQLAAYERRLDALSTLVAETQGSLAALPNRIALPVVTVHGAIGGGGHGSAPKPATTTRASGG